MQGKNSTGNTWDSIQFYVMEALDSRDSLSLQVSFYPHPTLLSLPNGFDSRILRCASRTFSVFVHSVQTPLVEGMLAKKVHRRKVQGAATGHASTGLEDNRLATQLFKLLPLVLRFGAVARYKAAVLHYR